MDTEITGGEGQTTTPTTINAEELTDEQKTAIANRLIDTPTTDQSFVAQHIGQFAESQNTDIADQLIESAEQRDDQKAIKAEELTDEQKTAIANRLIDTPTTNQSFVTQHIGQFAESQSTDITDQLDTPITADQHIARFAQSQHKTFLETIFNSPTGCKALVENLHSFDLSDPATEDVLEKLKNKIAEFDDAELQREFEEKIQQLISQPLRDILESPTPETRDYYQRAIDNILEALANQPLDGQIEILVRLNRRK